MNDFKYKLNEIYQDEFSRKSGILAINKPIRITSHDLVDEVRKRLKTRRVGHTGALDPFASGLMIILVGASTKLSNKFLFMDKEYEFSLLLGISTDTSDPEGKILQIQNVKEISQKKIIDTISQFKGSYMQKVPVFSSAKVNGIRLRELAHAAEEIQTNDSNVIFTLKENSKISSKLRNQKKLSNKNQIDIKLPKRKVYIKEIKVLNIKKINSNQIKFIKDETKIYELMQVDIISRVSKGTYIRQLACDIGKELGTIPAMLYTLKRTAIDKIDIKDAIEINDLDALHSISKR